MRLTVSSLPWWHRAALTTNLTCDCPYPLKINRAPHCLSYRIITIAGPTGRGTFLLPLTGTYLDKRFWRSHCHSNLRFLIQFYRTTLFFSLFSPVSVGGHHVFFTCKAMTSLERPAQLFFTWQIFSLDKETPTRYKTLNLYVMLYKVLVSYGGYINY